MKIVDRFKDLGTESAFDVLLRAKALEAQGKSIVHLHIGAPNFDTPKNIVDAACEALRAGHHKYTPSMGYPELKAAVAEYLYKSYQVKVPPARIGITPGGKPTMFYAILLFGQPGAEILYPNPGFPIYESMIRFTGATPVPIRLREENNFNLDVDEVLSQINDKTSLIILNTPGNPTGNVLEKPVLDRLVKGLEQFPHVTILADEIYSRITYDGLVHTSFLEYESIRDRLILLDGWSKYYAMTGWRLGFGVWPEPLLEYVNRLQINSVSCPNAATQIAGIEALRGPQDSVEKMVAEFDRRRKVIYEGLNALPKVSCLLPKGSFFILANIKETGYTSKELEDKLLNEAGVACIAGSSFGEFGEGYIRFSYAATVENIQEALRRIGRFLSQ